MKTYKMCQSVIKEMCRFGIEEYNITKILTFVPEKMIPLWIWRHVFKNNIGMCMLNSLPEEMKTYKMCLAAVKCNIRALHFVPPTVKGYKRICLEAVRHKEDYYPTLGYTEFTQKNIALEYMPEKMKTHRMCLAAVKRNGRALKYVPPTVKGYKRICLEAVKHDPYGFASKFVPKEIRIPKRHLTVINQKFINTMNQHGWLLQFAPEEVKTLDVCLAAVASYTSSLKYVPPTVEHYNDICFNVIQRDGAMLKFVPPDKRTNKMCLTAVEQNGLALQFVPKEMRTPGMCYKAINTNYRAYEFVPKKIDTPDMRLAMRLAADKQRN